MATFHFSIRMTALASTQSGIGLPRASSPRMARSSEPPEYEARVLEAVREGLSGPSMARLGVEVRSVELTGAGRKRAVEVHWRDARNKRDKSLVWEFLDDPEYRHRPDGVGDPVEVAQEIFLAVVEP